LLSDEVGPLVMVARRRWVAIGMVLAATALTACESGSDDTAARRRRNATETGSPVTTLPGPTTTTTPPDASSARIAYLWDDDVWVSDRASGANIRVTADRLLGYETAVRMHGPDRLTYATASDAIRYEGDVQSDVWDVDLTNGTKANLFHSDGLVLDFAWSPDGSTLAIMQRVTGSRLEVRVGSPASSTTAIFTVPPDSVSAGGTGGIGGTPVPGTAAPHIEWSPSGSRLLLVDPLLANNGFMPRLASLYVMEPSGGLLATRVASSASWVDESSVVVAGFDKAGLLERFDVDHGSAVKLSTHPGAARPRVSPDHNRVAYDAGDNDRLTYVFHLATNDDAQIGNGVAPRWLDAGHLVVDDVTTECPPSPSTRCFSRWGERGTTSTIALADGLVSRSPEASTLFMDVVASKASPLAITPATLPPVRKSGLTVESQIGYAGVGPFLIGMPLDSVETVTGAPWFYLTCGENFVLPPESGLRQGDVSFYTAYNDPNRRVTGINILSPLMRTISGIHVGSTEDDVMRTYGNVERKVAGTNMFQLIITNPEGRQVRFWVSGGVVAQILIAESEQSIVSQGLC
jgi:hypothetical protein